MLITATVPTWWCPPSSSAPPRDPRRSRTGPWRRCRSGSGPRSSSGSCSSGSSSLTTLLLRQWFSVVPWRWRSWTTPWRRCRFSGSSRSSSGRCGWCRSCSAPSRPSPLLSGTSYMSLLLDKRFFTWCIATANEQRSFYSFWYTCCWNHESCPSYSIKSFTISPRRMRITCFQTSSAWRFEWCLWNLSLKFRAATLSTFCQFSPDLQLGQSSGHEL